MAAAGFCPSGRLFEAAACGAPILSDSWAGLDEFFEPGREILVAGTTDDAVDAIERPDEELKAIARRARERTLGEHTAAHRAAALETILDAAARPGPPGSRDERTHRVGNHSGGGSGHAHSAAGVL
jgi:spore maturation protein CgeB